LDVEKETGGVRVTVKTGSGNRGLYSITISPPAGSNCGGSVTIYINVAL
jgi:hypothetical protein